MANAECIFAHSSVFCDSDFHTRLFFLGSSVKVTAMWCSVKAEMTVLVIISQSVDTRVYNKVCGITIESVKPLHHHLCAYVCSEGCLMKLTQVQLFLMHCGLKSGQISNLSVTFVCPCLHEDMSASTFCKKLK